MINKILNKYFPESSIHRLMALLKQPITVRRNLLNDFKLKKDKFNIELPLSNFLIFNNNCVHTSTKKKSIDIKNCEDADIISEVNLNIIKSLSQNLIKWKMWKKAKD